MSKKFGTLLKEFRQQRHFTLRSFAEKIAISPIVLSKFESNQGIPNEKLMIIMSEALMLSEAEYSEFQEIAESTPRLQKKAEKTNPYQGNMVSLALRTVKENSKWNYPPTFPVEVAP
ncbi:MAG: helix-turn-helix transcriptional regulator [Eubacteriales bacterium]